MCSGSKQEGSKKRRFNGLFNYTEDTYRTHPQIVGENYSPEIALKPRLTYIIITVIQLHMYSLLSLRLTAPEPEHQSPRY